MAIPFHKDLITLDGIRKTIINDKYAYRWFSFLLLQPQVGEKIRNIAEVNEIYPRFQRIYKTAWIYNVIFLFAIFFYFESFNPLYLFSIFLMGYLIYYDGKECKRDAAKISTAMIALDYREEEIGKMTLFQLCEKYAQKYNTISLVDAIYRLDKIYRITLFLTFIFVCYVILIDSWWVRYLLLLILYLFVVFAVNQPFFYKKLK